MRLSELIDQVVGSGDLRPQEPPRSIRRPLPRLNPAVADLVGPTPRVDLSRGSNAPVPMLAAQQAPRPEAPPAMPFMQEAPGVIADAFRIGAQLLRPQGTDTLTPTQNTVAMLAAPTGLPQIASGIGHLRNAASYPFESVDPRIEQELGSAFGDLALGGLGVVGMFGMMPGGRAAEGLPRVRAAAAPEAVAAETAAPRRPIFSGLDRDYVSRLEQRLYNLRNQYPKPPRIASDIRETEDLLRRIYAGETPIGMSSDHSGSWMEFYRLTPEQRQAWLAHQMSGGNAEMSSARPAPSEPRPDLSFLTPPEEPMGPITPPRPEPRLPGRASDGSVLPVRPREPFRNSLRGGSDDLNNAARGDFKGPAMTGPWNPRANRLRPDAMADEIGAGNPTSENIIRSHARGSDEPQGIDVYHGSPYEFSRFSSHYMGTGEGAQAYGHGHYVAENESVARSYREKLGGFSDAAHQSTVEPGSVADRLANAFGYDGWNRGSRNIVDVARKFGREAGHDPSTGYDFIEFPDGSKFLHNETMWDVTSLPGGYMYRARINSTPDNFIDLNAPVGAQPSWARSLLRESPDSMNAGDALNSLGDPATQAKRIREAGGHGVRYWDGGSRYAENGTRNYVVMRDDIMDITHKNDVAQPVQRPIRLPAGTTRGPLRGGSDDLRDAARRKPPPSAPRGPGAPVRPGTPIGQGALEEQMWRAHNPPPPPPQGITAYHGSPHDFDRFSMDHIGNGEGAQAYGHGLYFAENEGVARSYRDQISKDHFATSDGLFDPMSLEHLNVRVRATRGDLQGAIDRAKEVVGSTTTPETTRAMAARDLGRLEQIQRGGGINPHTGHMYQVRINSTPDNFVDLDAPVSAQPPHIRSLLERGLARPRQVAPDTYDIGGLRFEREGQRFRMYRNGRRTNETFASIDEAHQRYGDHPDRMMAGDALNALEPDQVKQAELLRNAGAHGVRYLDQGSRQAGQGTRNYVVMRDDILNITRKYGLPLGLFGGQAALSRRKAASS